MITVGIIGAGSIFDSHIEHYKKNPECHIKAIANLDAAIAETKAKRHGIKNYCTDFRKIMNDEEIDAVLILTPTFTHKDIVLEAIKSNKHIFCEKPPALNADEVRECVDVANAYGKCLMYGLVCRFRPEIQYLKGYIDSGKMGKIFCAEGSRTVRYSRSHSWFASKKLGGGVLRDCGIHELDEMLYLMNYPKPKTVMAASSTENKDLLDKIKFTASSWKSADKSAYERDTEDFINGFVIFEDGSHLIMKAGQILNTVDTGACIELNGKRAGAKFTKELRMIEISDDCYVREVVPMLSPQNMYEAQANHFINCCLEKEECICKPQEALRLMEIIDAMYKSAEMGEAVIFD